MGKSPRQKASNPKRLIRIPKQSADFNLIIPPFFESFIDGILQNLSIHI